MKFKIKDNKDLENELGLTQQAFMVTKKGLLV
jgi:hypothetical protein